MLAKTIKIKTMMTQREDLKELLSDPECWSCGYVEFEGFIYPENLKYFENEGFTISRKLPRDLMGLMGCEIPTYLFTVNSVELNEQELAEAEAYKPEEEEEDDDDGEEDESSEESKTVPGCIR